jgi:hypothetical protein
MTACNKIIATLILLKALCSCAAAQEMEPRAYSRAPVGTNFVLFTYGYQTGDILTDASLPIQNVSVTLNSFTVGYGHTFNLAGRQANIAFAEPYVVGHASGLVFEQAEEVRRSGLGDLRVRFSTNIIGSPALKPLEFATRKPSTVVGASLTIVAPIGQYDPRRLVNIGSNRWAFKPEVGVSQPWKRWTFEGAAGVWLFTANPKFFSANRREQDPLASLQGDVVYTIKPRMWASFEGTYYWGGHTVINGVQNTDSQRNSRIGATCSYPFGKRHSLKVAWAKGVTARFGGKLNTIAIGWQYTWF